MGFKSEKEMAIKFQKYIHRNSADKRIKMFKEIDNLFGKPDFVIVQKIPNNQFISIAIELKLVNWKRALIQAFRYKTFSNQSVVIIDDDNVNSAMKNLFLFERSKISLASFSDQLILNFKYIAPPSEPFSPHLSLKLKKAVKVEKLSPSHSYFEIFKAPSLTVTQ